MQEKRYTRKQMIGAVILTATLTLGGLFVVLGLVLGPEGMSVLEGFALIRTLFVGQADMTTVADEALFSMAEATGDRWTYYLDKEWHAFNEQQKANQMKGIGVRILYREDGLLITDVVPESGAAQAGLQKGETLIAVEGQPLYGETQQENKDLISGESGTQVSLTVRDAQGEERQVLALRGTWFDPPVRSEMLEQNIGYVRLYNFNTGSSEALEDAVEELLARGAKGLVFDVRQNGGGYVNELTEMLDYLLPEGIVFRQTGILGWTYEKESDAACVDLPMAVLVDRNSYSAAEIFAAQLRESVGSYIVGEHTSGKGYFQYTFPLINGGSLGLSIGSYTTGAGVWLAETGLEPDEVLSLTQEQESYFAARWLKAEEDPQLQAALAWQRTQVK